MCDHNFPGKVCMPDPMFLAGDPVITLDSNNGEVVIGGPPGGSGHRGHLVITDADGNPTFSIDGATGEISQSGDIVLLDNAGNERVRITGQGAEIIFKSVAGDPVMRAGSQGDLEAGGGGEDGKLVVKNAAELSTVKLDGITGGLTLGAAGQDGDLAIKNSSGNNTILMNGDEGDIVVRREIGGVQRTVLKFDASHAALYVGSQDNEGDLFVRNNAGQDTFVVNGNEGDVVVRREIGGSLRQVMKFDASHAALYVGSQDNEGDIFVRNNAGQNSFHVDGAEGDVIIRRDIGGVQREVFKLDASHAALYVGSQGNEGDIFVRNNAGQNSFHVDGAEGDVTIRRDIGGVQREVFKLDASRAALYVGCQGNEGDIVVRDGAARDVFHFDANNAALYVGANGNEGDLIVRDGTGADRIHLDGASGDIQLHGADCAEEFEVNGPETILPGTVLVIDDGGHLRPCSDAYDKKVAGVVSGGNGNNPGIVLGKTPDANRRLPVALNGKVYCMVDAQQTAVDVGDQLTTSSTPGHAMKAADPAMAFGAVIGKALSPIAEGTGLIPVLVALQ